MSRNQIRFVCHIQTLNSASNWHINLRFGCWFASLKLLSNVNDLLMDRLCFSLSARAPDFSAKQKGNWHKSPALRAEIRKLCIGWKEDMEKIRLFTVRRFAQISNDKAYNCSTKHRIIIKQWSGRTKWNGIESNDSDRQKQNESSLATLSIWTHEYVCVCVCGICSFLPFLSPKRSKPLSGKKTTDAEKKALFWRKIVKILSLSILFEPSVSNADKENPCSPWRTNPFEEQVQELATFNDTVSF